MNFQKKNSANLYEFQKNSLSDCRNFFSDKYYYQHKFLNEHFLEIMF
jgi:hypothetical protein